MSARKPRRPVLIPKMGIFFFADAAGGFQERAVTADADNHIGAEIVTVEQFGGGMLRCRSEVRKL